MTTLRPARGTRLAENAIARSVSVDTETAWRHPWFTEAQWSPVGKKWVCFTKAGFVNGVAPVVRTTVGALREARGTFFGQLVDAKAGADEIAQLARLASSTDDYAGADDGDAIDVPLYKRPPIPLSSWTRVSKIPEFFADRGAVRPPPSGIDTSMGFVQITLTTPVPGARVLKSCDVMINQPRVALSSSIEITPSGAVTGMSLVNQTLAMREPSGGEKLRMQTGSYKELQEESGRFQGAARLVENYEEQTWDRMLIATVYVLSPPDADEEAAVDETWEPYVQHAQFWNLNWQQPLLRETMFNEDIFKPLLGTLSVLGGGVGFLWASTVTASLNDAMQGAYNVLTATSLGGSFWTPTGGGTAGEKGKKEAGGTMKKTLDKAENVAARERAKYAARQERRLDPPFPYHGEKFNTSLLK